MKSADSNNNKSGGDRLRRYKELVDRLTLLDDIYMKVFFKDSPECAEYVLRVILDKPDLLVKSVNTDYEIPSVGAKSVRLDVYAEDREGR